MRIVLQSIFGPLARSRIRRPVLSFYWTLVCPGRTQSVLSDYYHRLAALASDPTIFSSCLSNVLCSQPCRRWTEWHVRRQSVIGHFREMGHRRGRTENYERSSRWCFGCRRTPSMRYPEWISVCIRSKIVCSTVSRRCWKYTCTERRGRASSGVAGSVKNTRVL